MSIYEPSVSCFSQQFYMKRPDFTLQRLLDSLTVTTVRQKFGPEGEPGVNVVLPLEYVTPTSARESIFPSLRPLPFPTRRQSLDEYIVTLTSNSSLGREADKGDDRC